DDIHKIEVKSIDSPSGYKPGEVIIRSIMLTNLGNLTENISIGITGNLWQVNILSDIPFTLEPNETRIIQLEVNIPITADIFDVDKAVLTIMAEINSPPPRTINTLSLTTLTGYRTYLPIALNQ
ncbi:MAG: hypothetical protein MUO40_11470, partial [Anaerolineaceae bacterium]|nr:hypothetical protein [Anaerolineaceae bacterium]